MKEIALPKTATVRDWAGVIPRVNAEKTPIASPIPRLAGVTAIIIEIVPIDVKNKASIKLISIPKT